jgi:hypothetical protein
MTEPVIADTVKQVSVGELIPYTNNPKEHPDEQVKKIASSIKNYGWDQPIVVDEKNEIIKGHGRLQAAELLGLERVPVIQRDDLTDAEKKASRIADNKTAESDWNEQDLSTELDMLTEEFEESELSDLTAFENDEIDDLLDLEEEGAGDAGKYTDKIETPVYEPTQDEAPPLTDLFDDSKYRELTNLIESSDVGGELEEFLRFAAQRHIVFDYESIAEYYAHQDPEIQELMEALTLVIIDYDQAVEQGFVKFAEQVLEGDI